MSTIYDANYFFRDFVTEEIACFMVGECYLYFYKETLIGCRDQRTNKAWFLNRAMLTKDEASRHVPTLDKLTDAHIQACIDEMQHPDEDVRYLALEELSSQSEQVLASEVSHRIDRWLKGTA